MGNGVSIVSMDDISRQIYQLLCPLWSAEISYEPHKWTKENPSFGQCVPTVLLLQDYLDGEIDRADVLLKNKSVEQHYWNIIKGTKIDVTIFQYADQIQSMTAKPLRTGFANLRDFVLSYEGTRVRYEKLKHNAECTGLASKLPLF